MSIWSGCIHIIMERFGLLTGKRWGHRLFEAFVVTVRMGSTAMFITQSPGNDILRDLGYVQCSIRHGHFHILVWVSRRYRYARREITSSSAIQKFEPILCVATYLSHAFASRFHQGVSSPWTITLSFYPDSYTKRIVPAFDAGDISSNIDRSNEKASSRYLIPYQ